MNSPVRRFGVFEIDLHAGELRRNGLKVKLQEQPFQALAVLLERPGEVVGREELHARLWPADTFVDFEHSLNAAIKRLRDALGDSAENPRFVETVARRGYRFVAPVQREGNVSVPLAAPAIENVVPLPGHSRTWWMITGAIVAIVLVFGLGVGVWLGRKNPPAPIRVTQLTANPADVRVRTAAISRDGKYLAFSDETGFYLRQIDTGETHAVALPQGYTMRSQCWSRDSVHLIAAMGIDPSDKSSLWSISALGGAPRMLSDDGNRPAVSPDGTQIAFLRGSHMHQELWIMSIDGEQAHKLAGEEGDYFGSIAWSPVGSHLAYTHAHFGSEKASGTAIDIFDLKRRTSRRLMSPPRLGGPLAWTWDQGLIYSIGEPAPHQADSNLWTVCITPEGELNRAPTRLTAETGFIFDISVSGDSKRLTVLRGVPQPDVYVANLEDGRISEPQRLTLDDRVDLPYDWTPDGKSVIFISDRTGTSSIYKQAIDQNVPELLTSGRESVSVPRLTPDGTQVLYQIYPRVGETLTSIPLMRVPLGGGSPQKVLESKTISNHQCAHAPSSVCVYSEVNEGRLDFFRFDPVQGKGAQVFEIKDNMPGTFNWSLSPDGNTLAIAKGKWGEADEAPRIELVNLNGGPVRWIEPKGAPGLSCLDWAADGESLWASSAGNEGNVLLNFDLQGHFREVWRPKRMNSGWAISSRDGSHLAIRVSSSSANVEMLENF